MAKTTRAASAHAGKVQHPEESRGRNLAMSLIVSPAAARRAEPAETPGSSGSAGHPHSLSPEGSLARRTRLSEAFEEWGLARPDPREVDSPPPEYSLQCDYCGGMGASDTLGGSGPTLCESCEESL